MTKRNRIIAGVLALLAGSGLALAGSSGCEGFGRGHDSYGHGGRHHGPMLERMIGKLDHHLDLSDQQQQSLQQILEQNSENISNHRQQRRALRQQGLLLDPTSDTYGPQTEELANKVAEMAYDQAITMATVYKQVSEILTAEQREEMRELMENRLEKMGKRIKQWEQGS